ncbi:MAG: hypothetical protein ACREJD_00645 [Phycisphaerales bacterium]
MIATRYRMTMRELVELLSTDVSRALVNDMLRIEALRQQVLVSRSRNRAIVNLFELMPEKGETVSAYERENSRRASESILKETRNVFPASKVPVAGDPDSVPDKTGDRVVDPLALPRAKPPVLPSESQPQRVRKNQRSERSPRPGAQTTAPAKRLRDRAGAVLTPLNRNPAP